MRTSEARVVFDPVMDIDIGQIEHARFVLSTKYTSDVVRNVPTKRWGKVVVFADRFIQLLERNPSSVSGKDPYTDKIPNRRVMSSGILIAACKPSKRWNV